MTAAERFKVHTLRPTPSTTTPVRAFGEYKGERVHPDVERRMKEFRQLKSLYGDKRDA